MCFKFEGKTIQHILKEDLPCNVYRVQWSPDTVINNQTRTKQEHIQTVNNKLESCKKAFYSRMILFYSFSNQLLSTKMTNVQK